MYASCANDVDLVKWLVDCKADLKATAESKNAVHIAATYNADKVLACLLQTGTFEVDVTNKAAETSLHLTSSATCTQILIEHKADIEARDSFNQTPFLSAAALGWLEVVEYLVSKSHANRLPLRRRY